MKKNSDQKQRAAVKKNSPLVTNADTNKWKYKSALAIIVLISFVAYLPVLKNSLLSWDDDSYITNNPLIHSMNLKNIFSATVMGNYHPLTILVYALEYSFFGLNPAGYHFVNLLLHLLNIILVFNVVLLLSDKAGVALVASLLFGIHPLHVESVAWAAEMKDLLYTLFFLTSYIFYLKYLKNPKKKYYAFALMLFLFSLLSKAMAASLPLVLILTDYFKGRKINTKVLLEKVPFFLLALILGIVAIVVQKSSEAITDIAIFTLPQRIVFACYGFITYLLKLILPLNLSAFYPYPVNNGAGVPGQYYTYLLLFAGLVASVFYSLRFSKKIIFGAGFFAATVFLVLQLLPVGSAIMADRYSYIPSIGIFYLAGEGFVFLWRKKQQLVSVLLLGAFTIFFTAKTNARCSVWKNGMTLWSDVISQYQTIPIAYYNRGIIYMSEKKYNNALDDYNKSIELKQDYTDAYVNRGNLFRDNNRTTEALNDYNKAIGLKPSFPIAYFNRGTLFMNEKRNDEALKDFNNAIELKPDYVKAYFNLSMVLYNEKKYDESIINYTKAIALKPDYAEAYFNRGLVNYFLGKKNEACNDLNQAAGLGYEAAENAIRSVCK